MVSREFLNLVLVIDQQNAKMQVEEVIKNCKSFKIGKTGQDLNERFHGGYADMYKGIKQIISSSDPEKVSDIEAYLINSYKNDNRCDNEKDGSSSIYDDMKEGAQKYYVYIVWR